MELLSQLTKEVLQVFVVPDHDMCICDLPNLYTLMTTPAASDVFPRPY